MASGRERRRRGEGRCTHGEARGRASSEAEGVGTRPGVNRGPARRRAARAGLGLAPSPASSHSALVKVNDLPASASVRTAQKNTLRRSSRRASARKDQGQTCTWCMRAIRCSARRSPCACRQHVESAQHKWARIQLRVQGARRAEREVAPILGRGHGPPRRLEDDHGNQNGRRAAMGEGVGGDGSRAAIHCAKALCGQSRPSSNEEPRPTIDHPPPRLQSYLRFSTRVSDTRQGSYERLRLKIAIAQVLSESNPCREVLHS